MKIQVSVECCLCEKMNSFDAVLGDSTNEKFNKLLVCENCSAEYDIDFDVECSPPRE